MKITVFGASGGVGRRFVQQALRANHSIRAVYRSADTIKPEPNLEIVELKDFYDATILADLVRGSDAVVSCLGQRRRVPRNPWSKVLTPHDFMQKFCIALTRAMSGTGMPGRLVVVSAAGVGSSESLMNPLLRFVFRHSNIGVAYSDLTEMESLLEGSSLDWTAVRPVTLTPGRLTGKARICARYGLSQTISRSDVADYLLKCAEDSRFAPTRTPLICR